MNIILFQSVKRDLLLTGKALYLVGLELVSVVLLLASVLLLQFFFLFFPYCIQIEQFEDCDTFSACWSILVFLIFYQTLTWSTGSLTSVCDLFACVYTWETSVYSLIWRTISFFQVKISKDIYVCLDLFHLKKSFGVANLLLPVQLNKKIILLMWTLVRCLILRWALNSSLRQLYSAILCFWVNPLRSGHMQLNQWL